MQAVRQATGSDPDLQRQGTAGNTHKPSKFFSSLIRDPRDGSRSPSESSQEPAAQPAPEATQSGKFLPDSEGNETTPAGSRVLFQEFEAFVCKFSDLFRQSLIAPSKPLCCSVYQRSLSLFSFLALRASVIRKLSLPAFESSMICLSHLSPSLSRNQLRN